MVAICLGRLRLRRWFVSGVVRGESGRFAKGVAGGPATTKPAACAAGFPLAPPAFGEVGVPSRGKVSLDARKAEAQQSWASRGL